MKKRCLAGLIPANLFALVLSALVASPASAELLVDFQNGVITPGGQTQIDVYLTSNAPNGESFFLYDVIFGIQPVSASGGSTVTFIDPMSEDFIDAENYVFAGNSSQAATPPSNVFGPITTNPPPPLSQSVGAFDETATGFNYAVPVGSTPRLLSRLMFQHNLNGASDSEVIDDVFAIILVSEFEFGDVAFEDEFDGAIRYSQLNAGVIRVVAVPEPGTFAFTGLMTLGLVPLRRRRR